MVEEWCVLAFDEAVMRGEVEDVMVQKGSALWSESSHLRLCATYIPVHLVPLRAQNALWAIANSAPPPARRGGLISRHSLEKQYLNPRSKV